MKAYTDIEQSNKLAEILPLESADMSYLYDRHLGKMYGDIPYVMGYKRFNKDIDIPCWSLAALLNIMPQTIDKEDKWLLRLQRCYNRNVTKFICTYPNTMSTSICDNPVDACVEMILKLKEMDLL